MPQMGAPQPGPGIGPVPGPMNMPPNIAPNMQQGAGPNYMPYIPNTGGISSDNFFPRQPLAQTGYDSNGKFQVYTEGAVIPGKNAPINYKPEQQQPQPQPQQQQPMNNPNIPPKSVNPINVQMPQSMENIPVSVPPQFQQQIQPQTQTQFQQQPYPQTPQPQQYPQTPQPQQYPQTPQPQQSSTNSTTATISTTISTNSTATSSATGSATNSTATSSATGSATGCFISRCFKYVGFSKKG